MPPPRGSLLNLILRAFILSFVLCGAALFFSGPARALDLVVIHDEADTLDLLPSVDRHRSSGDEIQISTAPGADGIVRRIAVKAKNTGSQPDWIVFALRNDTDKTLVRWLVAPHQRLIGSGVIWPDLGASRIANLTASQGTPPDRVPNTEADIFQLTLEPGASVTFVAELATPNLPELTLWSPEIYKDTANGLTFYRGIITGIIGLLALFLTVLMLIRGTLIFPAAALLAWAVAAYVAVDFGLLGLVLSVSPEAERIYRAGAEAVLAATLIVFLFSYLDLNRLRIHYSQIATVWLIFLGTLFAIIFVDPAVAAGLARLSIAGVAVFGFLLIVYLATHGQARAILLIPTWIILFAWVTAEGFTLLGRVSGDLAPHSLIGGLVLIILLIGFTVTQHAFSGSGLVGAELADASRKALALTGAGDIIFDWDLQRDQVRVGAEAEAVLGYPTGYLAGTSHEFIDHLNPADRDPFSTAVDRICHERRGRLSSDIRIKADDGHYHWFRLRARPVVGEGGTVLRLMGTLSDVTDSRLTEERLLNDAIHDGLTGLPNRRLLLDRIDTMLHLMRAGEALRPTVVTIDIDRFHETNTSLGLSGGDALLLAVTRRLVRLVQPQDGLARIGGDRFAILLLSEKDPAPITALVDQIRKTLSAPISVSDREANFTVSIGIALPDQRAETSADLLLRNAEIAVAHAKKLGGDRIEVFRPSMRAQSSERLALEIDLRSAILRNQIFVTWRPVVRLADRSIAGFEAVAIWDHPDHGVLSQDEFMELAESAELIGSLTNFILEQTLNELSVWHKLLETDPLLYAILPVSNAMLERGDFLRDVKAALARAPVSRGTLRVEVSETYLMDHPEHAVHVLNGLADIGTGIAIGDFGHGYSSLGYLERFPFGAIRLSRAVTRPDPSGVRPAILRSVVTLAHDLDVELIADGLETESDAIQFVQLGFGLGQGATFGPAMTAQETRKLIKG
ncbi:MAG: EAL domain-containing protein [Hyphomicrobiales bacterium]|nr:EAL domain-containing protein [Hyphomicrobiales bacterium]